VYYNII